MCVNKLKKIYIKGILRPFEKIAITHNFFHSLKNRDNNNLDIMST